MKKCPWCGAEYPDDATVCAADQYILESDGFAPGASAQPVGKPIDDTTGDPVEAPTADGVAEESLDPGEFGSLGTFDPLEVDAILRKFLDAGIEFQIDRVETQKFTSRGIRKMSAIEIFVRRDTIDKARKIYMADWIV